MKYLEEKFHLGKSIVMHAMFMLLSVVIVIIAGTATANAATVKLGGVNISSYNDNTWHAYNSKKPAISGWTAGKYKLSKDQKTLYIDGVKFSGTNKHGIQSDSALTVTVTGTNTFTCNGYAGIYLIDSDSNAKALTLTGSSSSILNVKCTDARSIRSGSINMKSGKVNLTGNVSSEGNGIVTISGGTIKTSSHVNLTKLSMSAGAVDFGGSIREAQDTMCEAFTMTGGTMTTGMNLLAKEIDASAGKITINGRISAGTVFLHGTNQLTVTANSGNAVEVTTEFEMSDSAKAYITSKKGEGIVCGNFSHYTGHLSIKESAYLEVSSETLGIACNNSYGRSFISCGESSKIIVSSNGVGLSANHIELQDAANVTVNSKGYCVNSNYVSAYGGNIDCINEGDRGCAIYGRIRNFGGDIRASISNEQNKSDAIIAVAYAYFDSGIDNNSGTITAEATNGAGIETYCIEIEGGKVHAKSKNGVGINIKDSDGYYFNPDNDYYDRFWVPYYNVIAKSGTVIGESATNVGIKSWGVKTTGGEVRGISSGNNGDTTDTAGISANHFDIKGGKVVGENTNSLRPGITALIKARYDDEDLDELLAEQGKEIDAWGYQLGDDIWISTPESACIKDDKVVRFDSDSFKIPNIVVIQKVTGMELVDTPFERHYDGDVLMPNGLKLALTFEDGAEIEFPYNKFTQEKFTFDPDVKTTLIGESAHVTTSAFGFTGAFDIPLSKFQPTVLAGENKGNTVRLSWDSVEGATGYSVYRSKDGGDYELIANIEDNALYDGYLEIGGAYQYYVIAERKVSNGNIIKSDPSNIYEAVISLASPELNIDTIGFDAITIAWDRVNQASLYEVYRSTEGSKFEKIGETEDTEFIDRGLVTGKEYSYKIKAIKEEPRSESDFSNTVAAKPVLTERPHVNVVNNGMRIGGYTVSWTSVNGATAYKILRKHSGREDFEEVATVADSLEYMDTEANCFLDCYYSVIPVRVVGGGSVEGEESDPAKGFRTVDVPVNPDIETVKLKYTSAKWKKKSMLVAMNRVAGADDYRVEYRNVKSDVWTKFWTDGKTSFTIKNMTQGAKLEFRFAAYKYNKDMQLERGKYSNVKRRWFRVTQGVFKAKRKQISVKLKKVPGASGYYLTCALKNGKGKTIKMNLNGASRTKALFKKLKPGRKYEIKWRPIVKYNGKAYLGILNNYSVKTKK